MKHTLHQAPTKSARNANDGRANLRVSRLISRLGRSLALPLGILLLALSGNAICGDTENLLKNAAPEEPGSGMKVPDWIFQIGGEEQPGTIEAGAQEIRDGAKTSYFFSIKKTTQSSHDNVWWRQDVKLEIDTPPTYELSFEAKGSGLDYGVYAGVAYIGADQSFDFHYLATIARDAANAKLIPPTDWREFRAKFTPTPGTAKLILRFGLDAKNPAECGFRNIVLKELK